VTTLSLPALDPTSDAFLDDQPAALAAARAQAPVAESPFGLHVLTHAGCDALLRDPRLHPGVAKLCEASGITGGRFHEDFTTSLLTASGERHRRLRRPVNPFFTARTVEQSREWLRGYVVRLVDGVRDRDAVDLQGEIAALIPSALFCRMVGVGESEIPFVARVSDAVLRIFEKDPAHAPRITAAYDELADWCEELLAVRRRDPGDDLASVLATADDLTPAEQVNLLTTILEASTDNTSNQLSLAVDLLVDRPDTWAALRAAPADAVGAVVDEAMRLRPRVTTGNRTCDEDLEVLGVPVAAGSWVFASVLSAQRDPALHDDPDAFRPGRPRVGAPLLFGLGPHYCIGAGLARMELEVGLEVFLERWVAVDRAAPAVRFRSWSQDGMATLPLAPRAA
jgi:cytochrome P450